MTCPILDVPTDPGDEHPVVREAAGRLLAGGIVAIPTETVYGLCATTASPTSVAELRLVKQRTGDKPFALLLRDMEAVRRWCVVPEWAEPVLQTLWPGALTAVLVAATPAAALLGSEGTIGVRVPDHGVPHALAAALESGAGPLAALVATSANRTGEAPMNDPNEIAAEFGDEIDLVLRCLDPPRGLASTVVDMTGAAPRVVRAGAVSEREILSLARR